MSRRTPNPTAERAAKNAQTIKSLLKLEGNKTCADCKRNKHPRWASWNIGVFICIRCSGIHRGMGTHISRVKSVDLDAWTDEQLQSIIKWGNLRANKYWEAKLAAGHIPSEAKIENFIRTKYESKRWVMDGTIPDPSSLEVDGDDDVPLSLVKEKQNIEQSSSQSMSLNQSFALQSKRIQQPDLLENYNPMSSRENSVNSSTYKLPPKVDTPPLKQTKPIDSLLGLDFFGAGSAPPGRSTTTSLTTGTQSRPDLKQSILSLYATTSRPQQQPIQSSQNIFGTMQSPLKTSDDKTSFDSVTDAFSSLKFSSQKSSSTIATSQIQPGYSAYPKSGNVKSHKSNISHTSDEPSVQSSGGFSISSGLDAFCSAPGHSPTVPANSNTGLGDIFDFATPVSNLQSTASATKPAVVSPILQTSVFNLTPANPPQLKPIASPVTNNLFSNSDAWGSNDAWASTTDSNSTKTKAPSQPKFEESGWGISSGNAATSLSTAPYRRIEVDNGISGAVNTLPTVSADEEFGVWGSATTAPVELPGANKATSNAVSHKPAAGFAGNDDLFSNVWG